MSDVNYTEPEPRELRGFDLEGDKEPIEEGGNNA